jgi:hypothetical protein
VDVEDAALASGVAVDGVEAQFSEVRVRVALEQLSIECVTL